MNDKKNMITSDKLCEWSDHMLGIKKSERLTKKKIELAANKMNDDFNDTSVPYRIITKEISPKKGILDRIIDMFARKRDYKMRSKDAPSEARERPPGSD